MVRHWKGWADVNAGPNQSQLTQSWCEKQTRVKPTLTPPVTEKHFVVTILKPIYQSQHSLTIHYTYNETLEGLRCCELLESIQTYSILVWWNVGHLSRNRHHPQLKSRGVVTVLAPVPHVTHQDGVCLDWFMNFTASQPFQCLVISIMNGLRTLRLVYVL